jgi:hypothetical protein
VSEKMRTQDTSFLGQAQNIAPFFPRLKNKKAQKVIKTLGAIIKSPSG